jgi:hypothetical protein
MFEINNFLDFFNPMKYFSQAEYTSTWDTLFKTVLYGFWARFMASVSLFGALWFGVYRRRLLVGVILFVISVTIAYLGGIIRMIFL